MMFVFTGISTNAEETISYPFDSVTITSAYKFNVEINEIPNESSFLNGHVEAGEMVTIYVGQLKYMYDGAEVLASESIIIVTNEAGTDIARWLINSYTVTENGFNAYYSSHITIDPTVGVVKTVDDNAYSAGIIEENSVYQFVDNQDTAYQMVDGSFVVEDNLNIVISAYEGVE